MVLNEVFMSDSKKELESQLIVHAWKDSYFRKKLLKQPEEILQEMGIPTEGVKVRVIEEKEGEWVIVLPPNPAASHHLTEKQLIALAGGTGPTVVESFTGSTCQRMCFSPNGGQYCNM